MQKTCESCPSTLLIARADSRFCSTACRMKAYRKRKKEAIPAEMRQEDRWVRRHNKRPLTVTGRAASSTNPDTWSSHKAVTESDKGNGIGFMLGGGFACIDLDKCIGTDGKPSVFAQRVLDANPDAWVELSLSGTGLHVWGYMPEQAGHCSPGFEVYSRQRFIALGTTYRAGGLQDLVIPD